MTQPSHQQVGIRCPNCQNQFATPVFSLVDVGVHPELKNYFLSGRVNMAVCPNCGAGGMLATPMAYHDPQRQLFLVLIPQELGIKEEEGERFIGDVTRAVMAQLPANQPKGYMLTPRRFISMQTLLDTVLEAEGISKEALAAQRLRVELIGLFAEAMEQDRVASEQGQEAAQLQQVVDQHREQLDYDFFMILTTLIETAAAEGQQESVTLLSTLRQRLMELTNFDAVGAGMADPQQEELIERLLAAQGPEQLQETIAELRPYLTDEFFEMWDEQIAHTDAQHAALLRQRREEVEQLTEEMDRQAQEMFEAAAQVLREVLDAPDMRQALRERHEQITDAFMLVIETNVAMAQRLNNQAAVEKMQEVYQTAVEVHQEMMTPEERLINQILTAESSQDATKLLRKNVSLINSELIKRMNEVAEQLEEASRAELAERMRRAAREAASMLF